MKYIYVLIGMVLLSCSEVIELELRTTDPVLMIYGYVTTDDTTQCVALTHSLDMFDTTSDNYVSGAEVSVTSSEGDVYEYFEDVDSLGYYFSSEPFAAKEGVSYTLSVKCDFDEDGLIDTYVATTTVRSKPKISSAWMEKSRKMGITYYVPYFNSGGCDEGDYWFTYFKLNGESLYDDFEDVGLVNAEIFVGIEPLDNVPFITFNFYHFFFPEEYSYKFDDDSDMQPNFVVAGDIVTFVVSTIDEGFYDFYSAVSQSLSSSNPAFGASTVVLPTNIEGGAMGYFGSMATEECEMEITE